MAKSSSYEPRFYREIMGNPRWKSFRSAHLETDLWIAVDSGTYRPAAEGFTRNRILNYRGILDEHIRDYPEFNTSLSPLDIPGEVHTLVHEMYIASSVAGTGPMSAVAGAIAEYICNDLITEYGFREVIVENGGDIFMTLSSPVTISVYAGTSPLSGKIGLIINQELSPISVCCSSGTVGHSLSFGVADACMIACRSGAQADAYATSFCNEVKSINMVSSVTEMALQRPEIISVVIIKDDKIGVGGQLELRIL